MRVLIITDVVIYNEKGKMFLSTAFGSILKRYYESFGKIVLCSRMVNQSPPLKYVCVDQYIDYNIGVDSLMRPFSNETKKIIKVAISESNLVVGRLGSVLACRIYGVVKKLSKPFYSEIMSDPWDAYWNHGIKGKIIAPYMYFKTKHIVKNSEFALYVTNNFLQERYPCKNDSVGVSNVKIPSTDVSVLEKRIEKIELADVNNITITTTAAVNVRYKGHKYVIKALPKLRKKGIYVRYIMVGSGDQSYLKKIAKKCGVLNQTEFTGLMSLEEVFNNLDKADIYIQPSLQEGLPRSVIEAMSRGCICIGARTAGIPELIEEKFVVKRKSVNDIVDKITAFCNSSVEDRKETATRNFEESKKYLEEVLDQRRKAYYEKVKFEICR